MIVVYWMTWDAAVQPPAGTPHSQEFPADDLGGALRYSEQLRARRNAGEAISHVTLQSELPQSVGPAGVADPPADYAHYKRRIDPATPLGRPRPEPQGDG